MSQKYHPIYEALIAGHEPDEKLWEELISHCRFEVRRRIDYYNFTFLANEDDIERIVHDFGYALARSIRRYDPERVTLKTYVNGIINNMVKDVAKMFNKRKREKGLEILDYCKVLEERFDHDPEYQAIIGEEIEELYEIIKQLAPLQYKVVKLRHLDHLSIEEIALQLGTSVKKVSNNLNKALERIRTLKERNYKSIKSKN